MQLQTWLSLKSKLHTQNLNQNTNTLTQQIFEGAENSHLQVQRNRLTPFLNVMNRWLIASEEHTQSLRFRTALKATLMRVHPNHRPKIVGSILARKQHNKSNWEVSVVYQGIYMETSIRHD